MEQNKYYSSQVPQPPVTTMNDFVVLSKLGKLI